MVSRKFYKRNVTKIKVVFGCFRHLENVDISMKKWILYSFCFISAKLQFCYILKNCLQNKSCIDIINLHTKCCFLCIASTQTKTAPMKPTYFKSGGTTEVTAVPFSC